MGPLRVPDPLKRVTTNKCCEVPHDSTRFGPARPGRRRPRPAASALRRGQGAARAGTHPATVLRSAGRTPRTGRRRDPVSGRRSAEARGGGVGAGVRARRGSEAVTGRSEGGRGGGGVGEGPVGGEPARVRRRGGRGGAGDRTGVP